MIYESHWRVVNHSLVDWNMVLYMQYLNLVHTQFWRIFNMGVKFNHTSGVNNIWNWYRHVRIFYRQYIDRKQSRPIIYYSQISPQGISFLCKHQETVWWFSLADILLLTRPETMLWCENMQSTHSKWLRP